MKPKTTYQCHVLALSKKLPEITEKQKRWAFEHCFEALGLASKKSVWCLECGEVFSYEAPTLITAIVGSEVTCPHCGKELKLENSRMKNYDEKWYYTIATTIEGFQVFRHFIVTKSMRRDIAELKRPYFTIHEAVQNWIDDLGRDTIIARPCKPLFYCSDAWDFTKPMEIRPYRDVSKYNINARFIYPRRSILPKIKRNGYVSSFCDCAPSDFCRAVLRDREAEMLVKNRQYDLFRHKIARGYHEFTMPFAHAIRVANRRGYIVRDASMWYDYLHLLEYFHLDTHNAHYVCPKGLKEAHDRLLKRKQRHKDRIERERKLAEAQQWEAQYRENMGRFFDIRFEGGDIVIRVLRSVAEIAEEGLAMHHCVYDMGYYKKPQSLIMSACDSNGNRLETIEVDLKTLKVVQSRGVCNKNTPRHNEILKLVRDNIDLIKRAV